MQVAGSGYASSLDHSLPEFQRTEMFHDLALRYVQMQLTQATQSAGCNAKHDITQRLARWLLLCADRSGCTSVSISQEFLAMMLGVQRTTTVLLIGQLTQRGFISHTRGRVVLEDVGGLEDAACECYRIIKNHLNNYLEFDTGFVI